MTLYHDAFGQPALDRRRDVDDTGDVSTGGSGGHAFGVRTRISRAVDSGRNDVEVTA
jgi:hypothetical protein